MYALQAHIDGAYINSNVCATHEIRKKSQALSEAKDLHWFVFNDILQMLRPAAQSLRAMGRCPPSKVTSFPRKRESSRLTWTPACAGVTKVRLPSLWVGHRPMTTEHDRFEFFTRSMAWAVLDRPFGAHAGISSAHPPCIQQEIWCIVGPKGEGRYAEPWLSLPFLSINS
jgi:hypothetical protein